VATDTSSTPKGTTKQTSGNKQKPGMFHILVAGADDGSHQRLIEAAHEQGYKVWIELPAKQESITGETARKHAADGVYGAEDTDPFKQAILAGGLDFRSVSTRTFKPDVISLEVPKPVLRRR
jgi:hypothetical protein